MNCSNFVKIFWIFRSVTYKLLSHKYIQYVFHFREFWDSNTFVLVCAKEASDVFVICLMISDQNSICILMYYISTCWITTPSIGGNNYQWQSNFHYFIISVPHVHDIMYKPSNKGDFTVQISNGVIWTDLWWSQIVHSFFLSH